MATLIKPKPRSKPESSVIEKAQANLDSLTAQDRAKRRQVEILKWEIREELPLKINAAREALAAAQAQPAKDERAAIAFARTASDRDKAELARQRTRGSWEPR